jgi:hypothetical protein
LPFTWSWISITIDLTFSGVGMAQRTPIQQSDYAGYLKGGPQARNKIQRHATKKLTVARRWISNPSKCGPNLERGADGF